MRVFLASYGYGELESSRERDEQQPADSCEAFGLCLNRALVGERENHFLTCVWPQIGCYLISMLLGRDSPNSARTNCFLTN